MENNVIPINQDQARLGVTWSGQYGELPDLVFYNSADSDIRQFATEAVRGGSIPGIQSDQTVSFQDFVIERFPSTVDRPYNLLQLRPKTPFGVW